MTVISPAPPLDRPALGITFMIGFCVLAPFGDALAKLLSSDFPIVQLVIVRFAVQAAVLMPFALGPLTRARLTRRLWAMTLYRAALHIAGLMFMFTSLIYLPLADALAIAFVMPFIMLLLGKYVLHEEIGPRRLIACCVGFVGTLLVIQPAFEAVGWPALLPLGVAVVFSLFMLVTRQVAKEIGAIPLQGLNGLQALVILAVALPLLGPEVIWVPPAGTEWAMLALIGVTGTCAHLLMTWSLRFAPSATVAPMQYLEIPAATLIGWAMFGDLPNGLAALGITITMATGLYIVWRENQA